MFPDVTGSMFDDQPAAPALRTRGEQSLLLFQGWYLTLGGGFAFAGGNAEFMLYVGVLLLLTFILLQLHARYRLPMNLLWCLSLWGLAHLVGGLTPVPAAWAAADEAPVLYSCVLVPGYLKYDNIVHGMGSAILMLLCWLILKSGLARELGIPPCSIRPKWPLLVVAGLMALGLGALNEVLEFVAVLTIPETNVGGYENTGWDLVANLVGVLAGASYIRLEAQRAHSAISDFAMLEPEAVDHLQVRLAEERRAESLNWGIASACLDG